MTAKTTSRIDPSTNGHPLGDAAEPENISAQDGSFDPGEFEADAQEQTTGPDPFDPAQYRITEESIASLGVTEQLVSIRCRKPGKAEFVRVHPDPAYSLQTHVIELKDERELYLVKPHLWPQLVGEPTFSPRSLFTALNKQGELFVWACLLPKPDGKQPDWVTIPLEAVRFAKENWTKVAWDDSIRKHRIYKAAGSVRRPKMARIVFR